MLKRQAIWGFLLFVFSLNGQNTIPIYKNSKLSTDARVKDLLGRMILEEKVAQMLCHWESQAKFKIVNVNGDFDEALLAQRAPNGLGQLARPGEGIGGGKLGKGYDAFQTATFANKIQKYFVEKTRLGIPVMFHEESLHGNQTKDATSFPSHLALGSTWNEDLLTEVYTKIAEEVRLRGGHQVLAPVVDLCRDPRWGRSEETLGEDPYHVSRMAVAEIKAYQGGANVENIPARHVISTLKHFGVHGASEGGLNIAPSFVDERTLREVYFPSFKACIDVGAKSLMPCYNELSGIPAHSNKWLLTDLLRKEWGFKGTIVSDYFAVANLQDDHSIASNDEEAAKWAVEAGVDVETPNMDKYNSVVGLVKAGKISMATINEIVSHVLTAKFQLGLFENPYTDAEEAKRVVGSAENRKIALKAAQESMVLLKNNNGVLPLNLSKYKRIAVVGPNADRCILGGYADVPKQTISPLQALRSELLAMSQRQDSNVKTISPELIYVEGVHLTNTGDWFSENSATTITSREKNLASIKAAVDAVRDADIILYFGGANEVIYREGWSNTHSGDRPDIDLFGEQNELILALAALKKPMVGFVFSGPPLACKTLDDNTDALVQCWYLGQETGTAVSDLILGNINPSGKLPITIPRSAGHIPAYYSYKPSAKRGYNFAETSPLYPFGHGLSYTTFSYEHLALNYEPASISLKELLNANSSKLLTVSVVVTNTGAREGAEVVQLYIRDVVSSVTRPIKELKDFSKITLKPGEKKTVTFTITPDKLSFYNRDMKKVVEPGDFEVMVGTSSMVNQKIKFVIRE